MEPKARRAMLDGLVLTGWTFVLLSLVLPWSQVQECPVMAECGPWVEHSGWDEFGIPAAIGFAVAVAGALVAWGAGRRAIPMAVAAVLGIGYLLWLLWFDFVIFGNVQGPLAGAWLAGTGLLLATLAGAASLLPLPQPRPPGPTVP